MEALFKGTLSLMIQMIRRDRMRLAIWIFGVSIFVVICAPYYANLYPTVEDRALIAITMENPAMVAIVGPVYGADHFTIGAMFANYMLVFTGTLVGGMNAVLATKFTRYEEESGRLELVRSLPVGRLANGSAAILTGLLVNGALFVLMGTGMAAFRIEGMDAQGCFVFAAAVAAVGFWFYACAALLSELVSSNRSALMLSFLALFFFYVLRAIGDVTEAIGTLLSPLGLMHRTEAFVSNQLWPLFWIGGTALVLVGATLVTASKRDLGQGVFPARLGKESASPLLFSSIGMSLRMVRPMLLLWSAVLFLLAALIGSMLGEIDAFIEGSELMREMFAQTDYSLVEEFVAMLLALLAILATVPTLLIFLRIRVEEKSGFAEHILARSVSRWKYYGSYLLLAVGSSILFLLLSSFGMGIVGSSLVADAPSVQETVLAAFGYLPAIWVVLGVACIFLGVFPRRTGLIYVYVGLPFFLLWFGPMLELPEWVEKVTPFGFVPNAPLEEASLVTWITLMILALVLFYIGGTLYRRREMIFQ